MPFPESERVIYQKNPLREVICQLRFPPILRIEAEPPVAYQESVRQDYPLFREEQAADPRAKLPPEVTKFLQLPQGIKLGRTVYEFTSGDEVWTVSLTRDFLALRCAKYERWEEFRAHLDGPLRSLIEQYTPAFFGRVGLRYVDVIQRSRLGLDDAAWPALLKPHVAGEFSAQEIADEIDQASRQVRVRLADGRGHVMVRHGLAFEEKSNEQCFMIDSDFFVEKRTETDDAAEILNFFNRQSGQLFRWCIEDGLHQAMEPRRA